MTQTLHVLPPLHVHFTLHVVTTRKVFVMVRASLVRMLDLMMALLMPLMGLMGLLVLAQ